MSIPLKSGTTRLPFYKLVTRYFRYLTYFNLKRNHEYTFVPSVQFLQISISCRL